MNNPSNIIVRVATEQDVHYASMIADEMASSAAARGTGIARRSPEYLQQKMLEGKAVIAHTKTGDWVGFCYIEAWGHGKYVANSGLIVSPDYRGSGVAKRIKEKIFELSRKKFPESKIFGLTTGLAVMKINSELGYLPVTYSELTDDQDFWKGCQTCVNYEILMSKQRKNCLCTGMLYDPAWEQKKKNKKNRWERTFKGNFKLFERWTRLKKRIFLRDLDEDDNEPWQMPQEEVKPKSDKKLLQVFFSFFA
jgi:GNAT superfamily N-acetyltransferase